MKTLRSFSHDILWIFTTYQKGILLTDSKKKKNPGHRLTIHCILSFFFLILSFELIAQETLVKIIPQADILYLDQDKGKKTYLAEDFPGFQEAKLYQLSDSLYALEVFYMQDDNVLKQRLQLSREEVENLQDRLYQQYFFGYTQREFDQSGRALLVTGSTVVGLSFYGYSLPLTLGVNEGKSFLAMYMLSSGAGFFIPYSLTKNAEVSRGQASMTIWGQTRGIFHGMMLCATLIKEPDVEPLMGFGTATSVLEGILNFNLAKKWNYSAGQASMYQLGGDAGAIGGLLLSDVFNLYENETGQGVFITTLGSSFLGLVGGKYLADTRQYTVGDAIYLRSSMALGSHITLSLVHLLRPEESKPYTVGALLGGATAGYFGLKSLRGKDYTTGQGVLIALGQVAGGLLGYGIGYLLVDDVSNSETLLIASAIGSGAGFGILSSQFSTSKKETAENVKLNLNFNPLGFYRPTSLASLPPMPGVSLNLSF